MMFDILRNVGVWMCLVFFCDDYLGCMESMKCGIRCIRVTLIPSVKMHVQAVEDPYGGQSTVNRYTEDING